MESETKGALIKVFVQKMKTRDMRVPAKDDFNPEDLPTDMVALCQQMEAEGLPIEFWYDTSIVFYDLGRKRECKEILQGILDGPMAQAGFESKDIKIKILISLAAFYLDEAIWTSDASVKEELFKELRSNLNKSDKLEINEKTSFVIKGYYFFFYGAEIKQSAGYFDNAKEIDSTYIPWIVGKACIEYAKRNFSDALDLFKTAIKLNPDGDFRLRLGLGYCYYQFDDKIELAKLAFESVLQKDPKNKEARVALSVILKRLGDIEGHYKYLCSVFMEDSSFPPALISIAEHYLYKGEFDSAIKLANHGLKIIDSQVLASVKRGSTLKIDPLEIKSKFNYILGFITHSRAENKDDFQLAFAHYQKAVDDFPGNYQAQYGLGQLYIHNKNHTAAIKCFEVIVKNKKETEACGCFKIMAYTYSRIREQKLSENYYELSIKYFPEDLELLIEYANYLESVNATKALEIYEKINNILIADSTRTVKLEFFNNLGVTFLKNKKYPEALKALNTALEKLKNEEESTRTNTLKSILSFNKGIVLEKMASFKDAIVTYEELAAANPIMQEPYLRLANIYFYQNVLDKTFYYCDKAIDAVACHKKMNRADIAFCLKAYYYYLIEEYELAHETLAKLKNLIKIDDPFATLLIGSIAYRKSCLSRDNVIDQKRRIQEAAVACNHLLKRKEEETNIYVGLTIAALFAEKGRFNDSIKVLNCAQEAQSNNPKVLYNLAFLNHLMGNYEKSLTILSSYNQKHSAKFNEDIQILYGINNFFLKQYKDAFLAFQKLVTMFPDNNTHLYNLAAFMHEFVKLTQKMSKSNLKSSEMIKTASKYLKLCKKLFKQLNERLKKKTSPLSFPTSWSESKKKRAFIQSTSLRKLVDSNLFLIRENEGQYREFLKFNTEQEKSKNFSKETRERIFLDNIHQAKMVKDEEDLKEKERKEELEKRAKEEMQRAEEIMSSLKVDKDQKPTKKKIKKNKNQEIVDESTGKMPLLNFNSGNKEEDQAEKKFEEAYAQGIIKSKPAGSRLKKASGKTLIKNRDNISKKPTKKKQLGDSESEEDLDLDLNFSSDDEPKKEPVVYAKDAYVDKKAKPQENDNDEEEQMQMELNFNDDEDDPNPETVENTF